MTSSTPPFPLSTSMAPLVAAAVHANYSPLHSKHSNPRVSSPPLFMVIPVGAINIPANTKIASQRRPVAAMAGAHASREG